MPVQVRPSAPITDMFTSAGKLTSRSQEAKLGRSRLFHAVGNEEPAVVAYEILLPSLGATSL
jgi:hypothetical protein